jgi:membrane protein required for colicin V production
MGRFLKVTGLSIFDHILGAAFGILRGIVVSVAVILGVLAFSQGDRPPAAVADSRIAPYIAYGARGIAAVSPYEVREGFRKRYDQLKDKWGRTLQKGIGSVPSEKDTNGERI